MGLKGAKLDQMSNPGTETSGLMSLRQGIVARQHLHQVAAAVERRDKVHLAERGCPPTPVYHKTTINVMYDINVHSEHE